MSVGFLEILCTRNRKLMWDLHYKYEKKNLEGPELTGELVASARDKNGEKKKSLQRKLHFRGQQA